jgi:hypothetical protein
MRQYYKGRPKGISTIVSIVIIVVVIALVSAIGATFLLSHNPGGTGSTISSTPSPISSYPSASVTTTISTMLTTSSYYASAYSSVTRSSATIQGTVVFTPSCLVLYSGSVHVSGAISPSTSGNVKSVELYWSYHNQSNWTWLNDLTYGPSFSNDGNFSHIWNPPEAAYYDFEANWTLASGQTITGITAQPFQVVAQGSTCP